MNYSRVLTIQDISCVGQCSTTVALPILSAAGLETSILPSAVLSTHTAGFTGFTVRDLAADMPAITAHWQKEKLRFDAVYTGYLGSPEQADYVLEIMRTLLKPQGKRIVDPAMADNGKLYPAFNEAYVEAMKPLCREADILLPNISEACFLTGYPYRESYDKAYVLGLFEALSRAGMKTVVLTGVGYREGETGVAVWEDGKYSYYAHKRYSKGSHGTGDVFASAFVGALMQDFSTFDAARIAADYTLRCIEVTHEDPEHWYGVKFEMVLPEYLEMLKK